MPRISHLYIGQPIYLNTSLVQISDDRYYIRTKKTCERRWTCMNNCEYGSSSAVCVSVDSRRFFTKEEKIDMLKEYSKSLENEAQGVKERIAELEKEQ